MPAVVPFIPAIISGAGALGSALVGSSASKSASNAQQQAQIRNQQIAADAVSKGQAGATDSTNSANDILSDSARQQLEMYSPYAEAGAGSLKSLMSLTGEGGALDKTFSFGQGDLQNDPGYQFILSEGQKAIQRSAAAQGGLFSGSTLKSLAGYTTNTANTHFNDSFNRAAQTFDINRSEALSRAGTLQGLAGLGYGATTAGANAVGNTSAQRSGNIYRTGEFNAGLGMEGARLATGAETARGNAQAAGDIGSANAIAGGIGGVANAASRGIGDFLAQRRLNNGAGIKGSPSSTDLGPIINSTLPPLGGTAPPYSPGSPGGFY